jgi:hypothetical protein
MLLCVRNSPSSKGRRRAPMMRKYLANILGMLLPVSLFLVMNPAALAQVTALENACPPPERALEGTWSPDRLIVLDPCRVVTGRVVDYPLPQYHADDGDVHNQLEPAPLYRTLLTDQQETPGDLVVELMPRDAGHLPLLPVGPRLVLVGALVYDTGHAWTELHPVYGWCIEGEAGCYTSGPQFGGTPEESTGPAREECYTETGKRCPGYEGQVPTYEEVTGGGRAAP